MRLGRLVVWAALAACGGKIAAEEAATEASHDDSRMPLKDAAGRAYGEPDDARVVVEDCAPPLAPVSIVGFEPSVCATAACSDEALEAAILRCPNGRFQLTLDRTGCLTGVVGSTETGTRCVADELASGVLCRRRERCLLVTVR